MKSLFFGIFLALASFAAAQNLAQANAVVGAPCQGGVGGRVFSTGDNIQIEILEGAGSFLGFSQLYLSASGQEWVYLGRSDDYGTVTTISNLVAGDELIFRIYVYPSADVFMIGPTNRNPDGIAHAQVFCETNGSTLIGFEEASGGGDQSYDDVLFRVTRIPARPAIVTQPVSQTVDLGTKATLSVVASGSGLLFYQWFKGNAVIAGATNSALSLTNFQEAGQGSYSVSVSNMLGQVSSRPAQLTINRRPIANADVVRRPIVSPNGISAVVMLDGSESFDVDSDALWYAWFQTGKTNAFASTKVALIAKPVGKHSFSLVVSDDRLFATNTVAVTVTTIPEALRDLVARINQTVTRPEKLRGKLPGAAALYARGDIASVKNELEAFQARVDSLMVRPHELAVELIQRAQDILDALNTPATQLVANASSPFQIDLAWTDRPANEEGFKIERSSDGVNFMQIAQVLPNTTTFRDAGRFPEVSYSYRVRSFRGKSNGSYSNVRTVVTPGGACALSLVRWAGSPLFGYVADPPEGLRDVVSVAWGWSHALALKSDGTVVGWGYDYNGQATPPAGLSNVVAVAAGFNHSMALKRDGSVAVWGDLYLQSTTPTNLSGVVAIAASSYYSMALKNDGTVVAWGVDYSPVPAGLKGVVAIATSRYHSLALRSDGTVVAWGGDYAGQATVPVGLKGVMAIAAGVGRSLALKNDGTVVGWGADVFGWPSPTNATHATAIAAGDDMSYALLPDGTLRQWGYRLPQPDGLKNIQAIFASGNAAATLSTLPPTPRAKELKIISQNEIQLTWTNSDSGIEGYLIERATNSETGNWSAIGTTTPGTTQFIDHDTTLERDFYYRIQSQNACGKSLYGYAWGIRFGPPRAPGGLNAHMGYSNRVDISWFDGYGNANGFVLERAADVNGNPGDWSEIATINATNNATGDFSNSYGFADTNVTGFTTNWYRVRGFNPLGNSPYSASVRIEIIPPPAPYVYASALRDDAIIHWYQSDMRATDFQIERASDVSGSPGTWSILATNSDTRYDDMGLALGSYWYRVSGFNWVGMSPASLPVNVTIVGPNAPLLEGVLGSTNKINLTIDIQAPYDQDGFEVERAADVAGAPGAWSMIGTTSGTDQGTAYFTDTNVMAKTTNWYRVRAFNLLGYSGYSVPVRVDAMPPPAPYIDSLNSVGNRVNLSWSPNFDGQLSGSQIDRAPDVNGNPGAWKQIASINNGLLPYQSSFTESGLRLGTYWYRVRTRNWVGISSNSEPANVFIDLPEAPTLSAFVGPTNQVNVLISAASPYGQNGFKVERAADVAGAPGTWSQIGTVLATNEHYADFADTHVTAHSTNWYRARAFNVLGNSDYSEPAMVELVAPSAPFGLTVYHSRDRATLQWYEDYNGLLKGFEIERAADDSGSPGNWTRVGSIGNFTTFENRGLSLGTHWYRVRAYNWLGVSEWSDPASVVIKVTGQPTIYYTSIGNTNEANIEIETDYPGDQDAFKVERAPDVAGSPGTWLEVATIPARNTTYATFTDTKVFAYTTNWYRARGSNVLGLSAYSDVARLEIVPPAAPSNFSGSPYRDSVNLRWDPIYSAALHTYDVDRAGDVSGSPGAWNLIATNILDNLFADSGLGLGTNWYRVRARNWIGTSTNSPAISVAVVLPGAPSITVSLGTTNRVNLIIYSAQPGDQDYFKVERATDVQGNPETWSEIATVPATNQSYAYFTDTNVMANSTNWYRARAFNSLGASVFSAPIRFQVTGPPGLTYFNAGVFRDQVTLSWLINNSVVLDGFLIERAPDVSGSPGVWSLIATAGNNEYRHTDEGLGLGSYWYRVRPYNWVGVANTQPLKVTIVPPQRPYLSLALGPTNCVKVQVQAAPPYDHQGFRLERAADVQGSPGTWSEIATNLTSDIVSYFVDTNVLAYTTNWYRTRSYNLLGNSDYSVPAVAPIIPPDAPSNLIVSPSGSLTLLGWNGSTGLVQSYQVERAPDSGGQPGAWQPIADVSHTTAYNGYQVYFDSLPNSPYWYRVRAYNWVGTSGYTAEARINPVPRQDGSPESSLRITSIRLSDGRVQLSWETTGGTTNFVEAAATLDGPFSIISPAIVIPGEGVTRTSFEDSGVLLDNSQRYYRILSR